MDISMNKRLIILISAATTLIVVGLILFIVQNNGLGNSPVIQQGDHYYHVDQGFKKVAPGLKLAAEAFATQNQSESQALRNKRLSKYFSADSPIFSSEQIVASLGIKKTTALLTSILANDSEGDYPSADVIVQTTHYLDDNSSYTTDQTYWITYKIKKDGSFIAAYEIGVY